LVLLLILLPARAVRGQCGSGGGYLDQTYCESCLNGTWTAGMYRCTIPSGNTGTVPVGDVLVLQDLYDIVVSAGATLNVNGQIWMSSGSEIDNSGSLSIGTYNPSTEDGSIRVYGQEVGKFNPGFLINAGTLTNGGKLVVSPSQDPAAPDRDGVVYNCAGSGSEYTACTGRGTIVNNRLIENSSENFGNAGDFTNNATVNIYCGGEINNYDNGSFTNNSSLHIHGLFFQYVGGSFTNASTGIVQLWSHVYPACDPGRLSTVTGSSFVNNGEIRIESADSACWVDLASFTNNSVVDSYGSFTVQNMTNSTAADVYNRGQFTVNGTLTNNGGFTSYDTMTVTGTINNNASGPDSFTNNGTLAFDQGDFTNASGGWWRNNGSITMTTFSYLTNHGTFDTYSGSTIVIPTSSSLTNDGTIEHRGSLTSASTIYNTGGTINKYCGSVITGPIMGGTVNDLCVGTVTITKTAGGGDATFSYTGSGTGIPASFAITTTGGTGSRTFSNILANETKTITESAPPAGWDFTSVSCVDPDNGSTVNQTTRTATIDLDQGETVTCNFTNTRKTGTIEVKKVLSPSSDPGRFNLLIDGTIEASNVGNGGTTGVETVVTGTYIVSETAGTGTSLADYTTTYSWSRNGGAPTPGSGTSVSITVNDGDTIVCTFTNEKKATIIIQKVTQPAGGTGFNFEDDIEAPNAFMLNDGETKTFSGLVSGTYTVTEADPTPDFDLTAITCDDGASASPSTGDVGQRKATINLDPGETVTCTFTNTERGTIIIKKVTYPAGGAGFTFTFDPTAALPGGMIDNFSLDDGGTETYNDRVPGIYTVTEDDPMGTPGDYNLTGLVCVENKVDNSTEDLGSRQATIRLDPGETVTCTFTNRRRPHAKGDVNGDGLVDLMDVRMCLQIATGFLAGTELQRDAADVDSDGDVDMDDAVILSEYVLGIRLAFP
jgi:hypothetical protein